MAAGSKIDSEEILVAFQGGDSTAGGVRGRNGAVGGNVISGDSAQITSGGTYSISSGFTGTITIATTDSVTLDGSVAGSLSNVNIVVSSATADLTIKDLNITNVSGGVIKFGNGTGNKMTISGTSNLATTQKNVANAGAGVNIGGGLVIDGEGTLNVTVAGYYGAGIGTDYNGRNFANLTINGGTINSRSRFGAAIGSGESSTMGDVIINGGTITAVSEECAIGTGYGGAINDLRITGGTVNASLDIDTSKGHTAAGAAIGAGYDGSVENIIIDGGTVNATSQGTGSAIGGGASLNSIVINDGVVTAIADNAFGAGIGINGYEDNPNAKIIITGGTVIANGDKSDSTNSNGEKIVGYFAGGGAGIGASDGGSVGKITINGTADVTATADTGAGIGSGGTNGNGGNGFANDIFIGGQATVKAYSIGYGYGAGIGSGTGGTVENIKIYENANVTAISYGGGAGIGSGYHYPQHYGDNNTSVGNIKITDNAVVTAMSTSGGAGIGTSKNVYNSQYSVYTNNSVGNISISGDAIVTATGRNNGSGIGIGYTETNAISQVGTISISGDASTSDKSVVTINNSNSSQEITINGKTYSGSRIVFEDGKTEEDLLDITGTAGADYISNSRDSVTIDALAGNDSIDQRASHSSISGGAGDDYVHLQNAWYNTISTGAGNDIVSINSGEDGGTSDRNLIDLGEGNDLVRSENGWNNTINAGNGNDTVSLAGGGGLYIALGSGEDSLHIEGSGGTIQAGDGADRINIYNSNYVSVDAGAGNDAVILNNSGENTINTGAGNDSVYVSENNGAGGGNVVNTGDGADTINLAEALWGAWVTVNAGADNDVVLVNTSQNVINGDAGNDLITVSGGNNLTINGGDGADTIVGFNSGNDEMNLSQIDGGAGNDSIVVSGIEMTINGGTGNDTVSLAGDGNNLIQYANGAGNDVVYNLKENDTLQISSGNISAHSFDGNDLILTIGTGKITLKDMSGQKFKLKLGNSVAQDTVFYNYDIVLTANADTFDNTLSGATISALAGNDTVWNYSNNVTMNGGVGDDYLNNWGADNVTINGDAGNDTIRNMLNDYVSLGGSGGSNVKIDAGDGNDSVHNWSNNVTISTGAGNDTIKNDHYYGGGDSVTIDAGADDDFIYISSGVKVSAFGGTGNDSIQNWGTNATVSGSDGNDSIENYAGNVTVSGGAGNDTLYTQGTNVLVNGDAGADWFYIWANASGVTVNGGTGSDSIYTGSDKVLADGGADNDYIQAYTNAINSTILGGDGNDTIYSGGSNISINGGAGGDFLYLYNNTTGSHTISGGTGNDSIYNYSTIGNVYQYSYGDGNDIIYNAKAGDTVSISGATYTRDTVGTSLVLNITGGGTITLSGAASTALTINGTLKPDEKVVTGTSGADSILNTVNSATISALAGNDTVTNSGVSVITYGGDGADSINNTGGTNSTLDGGAGNDYIRNGSANVKIYGGTDNDSISNTGNNVTIDGGTGNDSIENSGANISVYGNDGADYIYSGDGSNVTISGGAGNDSLYNGGGANVQIYGGEGNDYIQGGIYSSTLDGGAGDDTIYNYGSSKVNGGIGNDLIYSSGEKATINGGDGNDIISISGDNSNNVIQYSGGNDTISGLTENDTLQISSASISSVSLSNNDVILTVDTGKITLKNMAGQNFKLKLGNSVAQDTVINNLYIVGTSGADTIDNELDNATIDALAGNDRIDNTGDSVIAYGGNGDDRMSNFNANYSTMYGGAGNDSLSNNAGTRFIYLDGGDGDDKIDNISNDYYGYDGSYITLAGGAGNDTIDNHEGDKSTVLGGAGNDSIFNWYSDFVYVDGGAGKDNIVAYNETGSTVIGGTDNDTISLNNGSTNSLIKYASGDGNDVIYGLDSDDTLHITSGSISAYSVSGNDVILNIASGSITLKDMKGKSFNLKIGDSPAFTEEAIEMENYEDNSRINGTSDGDEIYNESSGSTINAGAGDDNIDSSGDENVIYGGNGNDYISSYGESNSLNGGAGADEISFSGDSNSVDGGADDDNIYTEYTSYSTAKGGNGNDYIEVNGYGNEIDGGAGNDTIAVYGDEEGNVVTGGSGEDLLIYNGGELTITDYEEGDTIQVNFAITSEDISYEFDDSGAVLYIGEEGLIRIEGISGEDDLVNVVVTDDEGNQVAICIEPDPIEDVTLTSSADRYTNTTSEINIYALAGNDTIENDSADDVKIDAGAGNDRVYNDYGWNVTVIGGAGADTIVDSRGNRNILDGGDGHDKIEMSAATGVTTVIGGTGHDTIINSNTVGSVYQYTSGDGNDVISGFNAYDTLYFTAGTSITSAVVSGDDVILNIGSGSIRLNDMLGETIHYKVGSGSVQSTIISDDGFKFSTGNDTYTNEEDDVELDALAGNDVVRNYGNNVSIYGNAGADTLSNLYGENVTLDGGAGNDYIYNTGNTVILYGGAGNDYIKNENIDDDSGRHTSNAGEYVTIDGGDGADTIISCGEPNVSINGGAGNDSITGDLRSDTTVTGGAGSDTIELSKYGGRVVQYANGDGNDLVTGFGLTDTLNITSGSYTAAISGSDWIITVGSGKITLKGAAENEYVSLLDASGKLVSLKGETPLPNGWKYNASKTIATASIASAEDFDARDYETVEKIDASKITRGAEIFANDNDNSIKGGKGADTIYSGVGNDTVSLGAGNDVFVYNGGDDVVQDFANGDIIQFDGEIEINDIYTVSSNVIFETSEGTITLNKARGKDIIIVDETGDTIYPDVILPEGWGYNSAKTIVTATVASAEKYLDLNEDYGEGVEKVDGNKITSGAEIIAHDGGVSIKAGKGADTVTGGAGDDTVSLGAGADVYVYTGGDDIIQDYGTGADTIQLDDAKYEFTSIETVGTSVTFTLKDKDDNEGTITLLKGTNKKFTFMNFDGESIDPNPIENLYVPGTTGKDTLVEERDNVTIDALAGDDIIDSSGNEASINAGAGKDKISLTGGSNITVYGGAGNDTIWNDSDGSNVYEYNVGGVADGKDVIVGYNEDDTIYIDSGIYKATTVGGNWQITIGSGNSNVITLKDAADKIVTVVDSAGNVDTLEPIEPLPYGWGYNNTAKTQVKATLTAPDEINLNEGYGEGVITIDGSKSTAGVNIIGNDESNSIKASKKNDYVEGGTGNDTISLGSGADTYVYNGGEDIIQDFGAGVDVIQISDTANITLNSVETVNNDIVITTSEGTITLTKAKSKSVTIYGADESEILYPTVPSVEGWSFTNSGQLAKATVAAPDDLDLNEAYGEAVITVDGSKATNGMNITGNDLGNSIKAARGDDCVVGGYGNDIISLGAGNDVYVYQGGEDIILDYKQGADTIKVDTTQLDITSHGTVGSDFVLTFNDGNGVLTVKGGKDKKISLVDQDDEEIILDPDTLPSGWGYVNGGLGVKVTSTAPDDLNLTEPYGAEVMTVDASTSKVSVEIIGNDLGNSIKASKYADLVTGGTGDDIISLGSGSDTYVYTGGNDVIQDFATVDAIQFTEDVEFESAATVGNDYVFTTNVGTITITKGKAKKDSIFVYDADGNQIHPDPVPTIDGWQISGDLAKATVSSAESSVDFTEFEDVRKIDASKISSGVEIIANDEGNSIKSGKGADEITGGRGNDIISMGGGADVYIYTGGDDYIQDYGVGADSIRFTSDVTFDAQSTVNNDVVLTTNVGNVTVKGGKSKDIIVMDENDTRIYPPGPIPGSLPDGWKYNANKTQIIASVTAPDDLDLMEDYGTGVTTVDGSKSTAGVNIIGNDENNSIKGGRGADCIVGGLGNDIISLGGGADTYVYTGGEDLIQDYNAVDKIVLGTNEYSFTAVETVSTNVIYTFNNGEGKVTVKGGKGKTINFVDEDDNPIDEVVKLPDGWQYTNNNAKVLATVTSGAEELDLTQPYGDGVATVDASKVTNGVVVIGHDNGISIKGSKGDDIITGGSGNDIVSLGAGSDTYVYQGGEDLIQDYAAGKDVIQFDTSNFAVDAVETVNNNVIYTFANDVGTITIKGGKGKTISFIDEDGDAIPSGAVSGKSSALVNDLFADDNFITNDAQIDSITEITATNYSVGKIENSTGIDLAQNDSLSSALAYSQEK